MFNKLIKYFLYNRLVSVLLLIFLIGWGLVTAPFNWNTGFLPSDPVPVDAIPDIGENQQIVFTDWPGRSPQDIEDQITYPLTSSLLGIPGVKSVRSNSMFGFSSIYIIFEEDVEFYWSRSRVLEKLNSLPSGLLPDDAKPTLGPDATALGQVFWYTLEGRDKDGNVTGGWDLHELRTIQDYYIKPALSAVEGVAEVASVGGYVQEYQIDVNPDALKAYSIGIDEVMKAVKNSNRDVGAKTLEINKVEYLVRGLGYIESVEDIENTVVSVSENTPVLIRDIAEVHLGPSERRGILDKGGADVTGGVVVARYGSNPLKVIENTKEKIKEISTGLPNKTLADGTESQLTVVPFYDRTQLIHETIGTLERALSHEVLISIIVILVLVLNLRASILISALLPIGVLMTFIAMRYFGVDANVVALSGIAIAIGVMVDVGIVFVENTIRHLEMRKNSGVRGEKLLAIIQKATIEVAPAVTTALATTIVSFIPVFFMENAEGKLFRPLAFTKTFALVAAFLVGILLLPMLSYFAFNIKVNKEKSRKIWYIILIISGLVLAFWFQFWLPLALTLIGVLKLLESRNPAFLGRYSDKIMMLVILLVTILFLVEEWMPLGFGISLFTNYFFVIILLSLTLAVLMAVVKFYRPILNWCLVNKGKFLSLPLITIFFGMMIWFGFPKIFGFVADGFDKVGWNVRTTSGWSGMAHTFPGVGKEFMPSLNEGSFLLMPTAMAHAGIEEVKKTVQQLDIAVTNIPEVEISVGKLGRVESALDPAPISMFENIINYKSEYILNEDGKLQAFKVDDNERFITKAGDSLTNEEAILQNISEENLIKDENGKYYRSWREHIKNPDDIWDEIVKRTRLPGVTSAPKLQPIETRLVMLQTGMRAPMGIKVFGPDLQTIQDFGMELESLLKEVPSVKAEAAFADRVVGKPYLEIDIDRNAIARYGLSIESVQRIIETAIGGMEITSTVEGRERFPVRVRYPRELRDDPSSLKRILIPTPKGAQIPLGELADLNYVRGPQMIKSEDTFLTSYVLFDKRDGFAEVNVVNDAQDHIQSKIDSGELKVPAGVSYKFSGNYENQVRAVKRLAILIPICLLIIFLLLYFQFKTIIASTIHFSGVFVAFAGGFIMIWLYGQGWFMDFGIAGTNMRDLFQMGTINLSVAVWVGFIALFGIATDDGVLMGTYIHQVFERKNPQTVPEVRSAVMEAGLKRVRPAMMTTAVTIIALFPVLTSTGKGSDIMVPMAIPIVGGMVIQIMTIFVVPVLQAYWRETVVKKAEKTN
ncbi:MAG: efflux RND transporter permease subunit [Salegentibacter sp.]|uniref:Cu(I)/Ag(I) efflux system membrane protein CusA/SilA n=1 Tax=Salegentibacter flavus TaxID=287099 RepID=A0A1I5AGV6_9FLAO|nr:MULTISPECIES: efflux RND transporter permease subunit [Salegentibacter]MDR9457076.1 efflux RND transporter permease subunit [Salegentibacter sp.]SFN61663.1 Cu(I)/Ag(I) efflux system membrane protein CusA/SilA [Salegentibacter flavus]